MVCNLTARTLMSSSRLGWCMRGLKPVPSHTSCWAPIVAMPACCTELTSVMAPARRKPSRRCRVAPKRGILESSASGPTRGSVEIIEAVTQSSPADGNKHTERRTTTKQPDDVKAEQCDLNVNVIQPSDGDETKRKVDRPPIRQSLGLSYYEQRHLFIHYHTSIYKGANQMDAHRTTHNETHRE